MHLEFVLNGAHRTLDVPADLTLLQLLRHYCGITSVKDGCAPQGQCGCCLALINGAPKVTCAMPAARADGADIRTIEGVSARDRELCARAFASAAGVQCGFCLPGIALRATWLLDRSPHPTRREIARAIDVHLCRCTGYQRIVDAIELYGRARLGDTIPWPSGDATVGRSLVRYRASDLVLGTTAFVADLARPNLLHGAVLLSPHAASFNGDAGGELRPGIAWATRSVLTALSGGVPDNVYNKDVIPRWRERFGGASVTQR